MQMQPDFQMTVMIKSLKDTIIPAINQNNKLAIEQANLVMGMLGIMEQRNSLHFRYTRDELERILGLSELLKKKIKGGLKTKEALEELASVESVANDVLGRALAEPTELVNAVLLLRDVVGVVIQAVFTDGEEESKMVARENILSNAKEQLLRERSWLIMQGWEVDPTKIPPVESLIGAEH